MKKVKAQLNHGRWVVVCPACLLQGVTVAAEVGFGDVFVCPEEHPNLLATALIPHKKMKGAFVSVADEQLRAEAKKSAVDAGDCYEVEFPDDKVVIERVCRKRPVAARNWTPDILLAQLIEENTLRGVE